MFKKLFLFGIITFFTAQGCPSCLTTTITDPYSGTIKGHATPQSAGCSCPCNKPRHNGIVCSECEHKIRLPQTLQGTTQPITIGSIVEKLSKK